MYDLYLRLAREEILSSKPISIAGIKVSEYKMFIKNSLSQLMTIDKSSHKYFIKALENIEKDLEVFTRFRLTKIILGTEIPADSFDHDLLMIIERFIEYLKKYLSGFYIEHDENILAIFKRDCFHNNILFRKNDLAIVSPVEGVKLYIDGCVDFVKEPYIKYQVLKEQS